MSAGIPPLPPSLRDEPDGDDLELLWVELESARPRPFPTGDTDRGWVELQGRLDASRVQRSRDGTGGLRSGLAAAAVLLLLLTGAVTWVGLPSGVEAPPGTMASFTLPDGSTADLNSGSRLEWRRSLLPWGDPSRTFRLRGEAYLSVVSSSRPFVVETFNARITVLGTRFNVRAREGIEPNTEVVLEEGRVQVAALDGGPVVELAPGEGSVVLPGAEAPRDPAPVQVDRALLWREQGFSVVDRTLRSVLEELSLRYGAEIRMGAAVDGLQRLNVHYGRLGNPRDVLADIAVARGLRFRETSTGFEVY